MKEDERTRKENSQPQKSKKPKFSSHRNKNDLDYSDSTKVKQRLKIHTLKANRGSKATKKLQNPPSEKQIRIEELEYNQRFRKPRGRMKEGRKKEDEETQRKNRLC